MNLTYKLQDINLNSLSTTTKEREPKEKKMSKIAYFIKLIKYLIKKNSYIFFFFYFLRF